MTLTRHSVPGTAAAFTYQFPRALYWLAQSPAGAVIGIETDDDVAVRRADGSHVLEQDKHSILDDAEPFGDRSKDLWNTLAIWVEALDNKEVPPDNSHFLMVTNKTLPECLAHQIGRAQTDPEITTCIAALELVSKEPPAHIASLVERVLANRSRTSLQTVIRNCEMSDGSQKTAGPELREQTIAHLQLPASCFDVADSIMDELLGWLNNSALIAWQNNQPSWIQRDHFVNQLHAIIDRRKRYIARERSEHLIEVTDAKVGENKASRFVKQLNLITDDDTVVDNAIRDWVSVQYRKEPTICRGKCYR